MTTDITELAQRMKAAAEKATPGPWYVHDKPCEDGNYGIDTSDKEFLAEAVVWWGFARQSIWREEDAKYIALANPANILALVEALEKAQQVDEELCRLLPPGVEYMDPPDGGDVTPLEGVRRMVADYRQRIAQLESRTVRLPEPFELAISSSGLRYYYADEVDAAIIAAGIKVEAK
ncbi:ead/Ea22-like family protein [Klebsiella pneumoniae]|nr:ead/Ea22-like family protein [Klebsiella pneumoniae]MCP6577044.1 ead/Ea22-like family protein [Klebsiella pneumoniae]MCP6607729.1 ead/Ea22-like family protein [Klebsiella pneumoniae]